MKKIVRLTENDLARIVKRVLREQSVMRTEPKPPATGGGVTPPTEPKVSPQNPIKIKLINASGRSLMIDIDRVRKKSQGCFFDFTYRGDSIDPNKEEEYRQMVINKDPRVGTGELRGYAIDRRTLEWYCDDPLVVNEYKGSITKNKLPGDPLREASVSQKASELLVAACGCDEYASTKQISSFPNNYV